MQRLLFWSIVLGSLPSAAGASPPVDFLRDIRPILSDSCFPCHGPDQAKRKAGLRLDTEDGLFAPLEDGRIIVPGKPGESVLYQRVVSPVKSKRMPPPNSGRQLTEPQIARLSRWIEQGAKWQKHWSFTLRRPVSPLVKDWSRIRNPIDLFVQARLETEGLTLAPEADRATLLRRVTLDLTGLPPTPFEVDAFLNDPSPTSYDKVVDRLLQSPRYGERMAARWLDAARYADTNGYQTDGPRTMWRWRDWVIEAFQRNMPFDQFTIEQLAGDLLPNPTLEQRIATGFHRNHRGNGEGGIIPEEAAATYVFDRVETTATVWLGLTLNCARCHDHKYDPITQKEFYRLYAYFNNVPEHGRAIKLGNSPPFIPAPTVEQQARLAKLNTDLAAAEEHYRRLQPACAIAQAAWESSPKASQLGDGSPLRGLVAHFPFDEMTLKRVGSVAPFRFQDGEPCFGPGRIGAAAQLDGKRFVDGGDVGHFGFFDKFSLAAWMRPEGQDGTILSRMRDEPGGSGYSLALADGRIQVNLVLRWLDDAIRVETERPVELGRWHHVAVTYDGTRLASGIQLYLDGKPEKLAVRLDALNTTFATPEPFRIGAGNSPANRFHGSIDDVRIHSVVLAREEVQALSAAENVAAIVALPAAQRDERQAQKLRLYFLESHAPPVVREARRRWKGLAAERERLVESLPTAMVMAERTTPRDTFVLRRGEYDKHGEKVQPGVPGVLPPPPPAVPSNRLGLARWLVDRSNPLTPRVAVNRYWEMYFGRGLVKTVEDFGAQGEAPTHQDLLDWLATEFVRTGWDVKALQKLIVSSATYRQSSRTTPARQNLDPDNRLLARGPRLRLSAEMIRDQALAISGLLTEKIGGPSVKTYQPTALWKDLLQEDYVPDQGPSLYRRSLYTLWKRSIAPPSLVAFDSATREMCVVRTTRTNTPLQALVLLNEITYVEAARVLAQRVMNEGGVSPEERIAYAFRLATARWPRPAERTVLLAGFKEHLAQYRQDQQSAGKFARAGQAPAQGTLDISQLAAYSAIANLILNLDETITKE